MRKRAGELVKGDFVAALRDKDKEAVAVKVEGVSLNSRFGGGRLLPTFRYRVLTGEDKERVFSAALDPSQEVEVFESAAAVVAATGRKDP